MQLVTDCQKRSQIALAVACQEPFSAPSVCAFLGRWETLQDVVFEQTRLSASLCHVGGKRGDQDFPLCPAYLRGALCLSHHDYLGCWDLCSAVAVR